MHNGKWYYVIYHCAKFIYSENDWAVKNVIENNDLLGL